MEDINAINRFIQEQLVVRELQSVTAVQAAIWLDKAGLLADSSSRAGKKLRDLLRAHEIAGQRQELNGRWYIDRVDGEVHEMQVGRTEQREAKAEQPADKGHRDEDYVIGLCIEVLGAKALKQHRFDFLRGDAGRELQVDAYYPSLNLVIEYRECQHTEAVPHFDKPDRLTVSGVHRGKQRAIYDQRRRDVLPRHGIRLIEIEYSDLAHRANGRLLRDLENDLAALRSKLADFTP